MTALLLWLWSAAAAVAFGPWVYWLGAGDWQFREYVHTRFERVGLAAYPVLAAGRSDRDPEIARRCRRLAGKWDRRALEARAWWALVSPDMPADPVGFADDHDLRLWVRQVYRGCGLPDDGYGPYGRSIYWGLAPEEVSDLVDRWWGSRLYWTDPWDALARCRARLRAEFSERK